MKNAPCLKSFDELDTLTFEESKPYQRIAQKMAATQFVDLYEKFKDTIKKDETGQGRSRWGFELETYHLKTLDPETSNGCRYVEDTDIKYLKYDKSVDFIITSEYLGFMLELIPGVPFRSFVHGKEILDSFKHIRKTLYEKGKPGSEFFWGGNMNTIGTKWGLEARGMGGLTQEEVASRNPLNHTRYADERLIYFHPRYLSYTRNIPGRTKRPVEAFYPLFKDVNTDLENVLENETRAGFCHIDGLVISCGQSSLQATFECYDLDEARRVYDQFHYFTAIFQALSANTPTIKDKLIDYDVRIPAWEQCNDARNPRERPDPSKPNQGIEKSRAGPLNFYISKMSKKMRKIYNDRRYTINIKQKKYIKKLMKKRGLEIDQDLLNHIASVLVRQSVHLADPRMLDQPEGSTDAFELFNGSLWNDLRFKPPPTLDSDIGWRVEFRTMDAQTTPEQNFLFCHALLILFRLITDKKLNLNFLIPITKVRRKILNFRFFIIFGKI